MVLTIVYNRHVKQPGHHSEKHDHNIYGKLLLCIEPQYKTTMYSASTPDTSQGFPKSMHVANKSRRKHVPHVLPKVSYFSTHYPLPGSPTLSPTHPQLAMHAALKKRVRPWALNYVRQDALPLGATSCLLTVVSKQCLTSSRPLIHTPTD